MGVPRLPADLAGRLQALRRAVGDPSASELVEVTGLSRSSLTEVLSTRRYPPSGEFVRRFVHGCVSLAARSGHTTVAPISTILRALRITADGDAFVDHSRLIEREEVLARCSARLDQLDTAMGVAIVIQGAAGIGKSAVLEHVQSEALIRGVEVRSVRCHERLQRIPFGGARELLRRWVEDPDERGRLLAGPAGLSERALGLSTVDAAPTDQIAQIEALYWLLINATTAAGQRPLMLWIDDAHWLDDESARWLAYLVQRLSHLHVVIALGMRSDEEGTPSALEDVLLGAAEVIRLSELTAEACAAVVSTRLATAVPDAAHPSFLQACHRRSAGNPFFLHQLVDFALARGLPPTAEAAAEIERMTPDLVTTYIIRRLVALGLPARQLARAAAVLGTGPIARTAALAKLPEAAARTQADRLARAGFIHERSPAELDWTHPIIRSAVYEQMQPSIRHELHREAARLLAGEPDQAEAAAAQLLMTPPGHDQWAVQTLHDVAEATLAGGHPAAAARYVRRALKESPPAELMTSLHLLLGRCLAPLEVSPALEELRKAYRLATSESERTEAAISLAKTHAYADELGLGVRLLEQAIITCNDDDARQQLLAEQFLWATWWAKDADRLQRMRQLALIAEPLPGHGHLQRLLLTNHAWNLVLQGEPRQHAVDLIHRVIRSGVTFADAVNGMEVATMSGFVWLFSNDLKAARDMFQQGVTEMDKAGWRGTHQAFCWTHLANIALREGRLADAEADAGTALRLAQRAGGVPATWFATGILIQTLMARQHLQRALDLAERRGYFHQEPDALVLPIPGTVRGALLTALLNSPSLTLRSQVSDPRAGVNHLRTTGAWADQAGLHNPAICPWRIDLAVALHTSAAVEAEALAITAHHQAERFGCPATQNRALRALALTRPDERIDQLRHAVRLLDVQPNHLDRALTQHELGLALLEAGHTAGARQPLTEALDAVANTGAGRLWTKIATALGETSTPVPTQPRWHNLTGRQIKVLRRRYRDQADETTIAYEMALELHEVREAIRAGIARLGTSDPTKISQQLPR